MHLDYIIKIGLNLKTFQIPNRFKKFQSLLKKTSTNRLNCIFLPFDAVLKALK